MHDVTSIYSTRFRKFILTSFSLLTLLVLFSILYLSVGSISISPSKILCVIANTCSVDTITRKVLLDIRLPRLIATIIGGAALSVSGLLLQTLFRNPIVGPWVLGVESGAILFVAILMLTGSLLGLYEHITPWSIFMAALAGALLTTILIMFVASIVRNVVVLLLIGIMIGYMCNAVVHILIVFAESQRVHAFAIWLLGSFSTVTWRQVEIMTLVSAPTLALTLLLSKFLNAYMLGESYAKTLGVNVKLMRVTIVLVSSVLTSVIVAFTGPISFIGVAIPHIARLILQMSDMRFLLPTTILVGSLTTMLCDLCARTVLMPVELPISAVTSIIGAPIVILLLVRRRTFYE